MKFINYLESISGISVYGMASLLIFGVFFLLVFIWSIKADKNLIDELRKLPFDNNN